MGKVHTCRQCNKIQQGCSEIAATEVALCEHFHEVNSLLYVKKSKWLEGIRDGARGGLGKGLAVMHMSLANVSGKHIWDNI